MCGRSYYDDNYGHWEDMDDPDTLAFYGRVQRESVRKKCAGCGRSVKLRPDYAYCNSCAERLERGEDF
jgi:hypothetical protein